MLNKQIFINNLTALKQYYPDIAERLNGVQVGNRYNIVQAEGSLPNLIHKATGMRYYLGGPLNLELDNQFKNIKNAKMAVMLGIGLGYELMYYMDCTSRKCETAEITVIEQDPEVFISAMNVTDLTRCISNEHVKLFIGEQPDKLYAMFRQHFTANLNKLLLSSAMKPVGHMSSLKFGRQYYGYVFNVFCAAYRDSIQNFGNDPDDSLIGVENMLDNVWEIANNPGVNLLFDKFKGKPAVIVATGPSLNKNKHLLKDIGDKALIVACDASLKVLLKDGIKPHLVTSLEREHNITKLFDNIETEQIKDVYMAACPVLFNETYQAYTGPRIIVYRQFDHFKWLGIDRGMLNIKLSSGNMAFKVAESLGCDPIILIGQDLAYGENGETHAAEVAFSSEGEQKFYVKGNCQEQVLTNSGWNSFLKSYEVDVSEYKGNCINATEGGAFINGTTVMDFQSAIDKYVVDTISPLNVIQEATKDFNPDNDMEILKTKIDQAETDIKFMVQQCIDGIKSVESFEEELKSIVTDERLKEIIVEVIKYRNECIKLHDTWQLLLMHVVQSYHIKYEIESLLLPEITDNYKVESILKMKEWYCFIGDMVQVVLQSLLKAKERIHAGI
jgi:hypothetical protein